MPVHRVASCMPADPQARCQHPGGCATGGKDRAAQLVEEGMGGIGEALAETTIVDVVLTGRLWRLPARRRWSDGVPEQRGGAAQIAVGQGDPGEAVTGRQV